MSIKIGIVGAAGRMGRALVRQITATPGGEVFGAVERPGSDSIGKDAGSLAGLEPLGITVTDDAIALFAAADVVIDFTSPAATVEHSMLAAQGKTAHIVGTTGLSAEDEAALERAARHTPVVYAANYSLGVNILTALIERTAAILGDDWDIDIVEMHHRHKVDAPSGTALMLGKAAARGRAVNFDSVKKLSREGLTGARPAGEIGFASLRGGDVVGEHTAIFAAPAERIEFTHKATDRALFARGAVRAALWAGQQKPGLYSMVDVLGLHPS